MHLLVGGGEAGERHDRGSGDERGRNERVIEAEGPATRRVQAEADSHEGQDVEEVALLCEVGGSEQARLADQ